MKIKKEIQEKVIYDYLNTDLKVFEIAKNYGLCRQSIRHIILENNLNLRDKKTSSDIIKNVINDYLNDFRNKDIAKKYDLNRCVVQEILISNNIKLKSLSETSRKHQLINENYFNKIDTEEKAYILGLLYADGNLNSNGFEIALMEEDKELLEKISTIFYEKIVLGYRKSKPYMKNSTHISKPQYRFNVVSNIIKNDLIKHGCMQAKTFKIRFPILRDDLYQHFIRGYFDGDGCLCIPTTRPNNVTVTITSNTMFCDDLAKYIRDNVSVNMKSCLRYGDISNTRLTGSKQVKIFMNWLYENSTIYMERKHEKFKKIINFTK